MQYREILCTSLVRKITRPDTLFHGMYSIDPYQNCEFGCSYCDSSQENVIYIKQNADAMLQEELEELKQGPIIIGSVHDPYQPCEQKYEITKKILQIIKKNDFPCHILTKSPLIIRDKQLLTSMDSQITVSLLSLQEKVSSIFEKNITSTIARLKLIKQLNQNKIKAGVALIPILPYITDKEIEKIIRKAKKYSARYFLYKQLELKGEQKEDFFEELQKHYPTLIQKYHELYKSTILPSIYYSQELNKNIRDMCKKYDFL